MSADYWILMPDPYGCDQGPDVGKCNLCLRLNHLHSVGEVPGQGAFGPQLWLCAACIARKAVTCPSCGEQCRVSSTEPEQRDAMCVRCRTDLQDYYDNLREQA